MFLQKNKIPERMCIGCREQKDKLCLCRVVRDKEGLVSLDKTGKKPGRGAYICKSVICFEKAIKSKAFERALNTPLDEEVILQLKEELVNE
jgi:predicted RNA-binding protein YlxR (DUF448 family)